MAKSKSANLREHPAALRGNEYASAAAHSALNAETAMADINLSATLAKLAFIEAGATRW